MILRRDLREPLNAIRLVGGLLRLLIRRQGEVPVQEAQRIAEQIERSSAKMMHLLADLPPK